jgi:hypothetical protein
MRDSDRIPMILAAVERRWRKHPDARLGQLLVSAYRRSHDRVSTAPARHG